MMRKFFVGMWLCLFMLGASDCEELKRQGSCIVEERVDHLSLLIEKRLGLMYEVARTKWKEGKAIEDKAREEKILSDLALRAKEYDLDGELVKTFFRAQIEEAKKVQASYFATWKAEGLHDTREVLSLSGELRGSIDQLNEEILLALSQQLADEK